MCTSVRNTLPSFHSKLSEPMKAYSWRAILLWGFVAAHAMPLRAQTAGTDPVTSARIRLGPFGITPSIALTNLGVDSNVFNSLENPQQDFRFTLSPQVNSWFRAGRSRTSVIGRA